MFRHYDLVIAAAPRNTVYLLALAVALLLCALLMSSPAKADDDTITNPSYAVQAGLYVGPIQSNRMAENLIHAGYAAWVEERPQGQGKMLYFVMVGPFAEESQALEAAKTIRNKFEIDPFIVDLNKR